MIDESLELKESLIFDWWDFAKIFLEDAHYLTVLSAQSAPNERKQKWCTYWWNNPIISDPPQKKRTMGRNNANNFKLWEYFLSHCCEKWFNCVPAMACHEIGQTTEKKCRKKYRRSTVRKHKINLTHLHLTFFFWIILLRLTLLARWQLWKSVWKVAELNFNEIIGNGTKNRNNCLTEALKGIHKYFWRC